jgi:hypothetical protein
MGNRIENPNDSRLRRSGRLLRSGLFFLAPLVALVPQSVYAQTGIKHVTAAEAIRPSSDFADRPFRIYVPDKVASNLSTEQLPVPGMARSMIMAGEAISEAIIEDLRPTEADQTSGN